MICAHKTCEKTEALPGWQQTGIDSIGAKKANIASYV